jgi:DNA-binding NarL/FixJ family response regulator
MFGNYALQEKMATGHHQYMITQLQSPSIGHHGCFEAKVAKLTVMENRVLMLVTLAKTNKEIARALGISPATVKRHVENLLRKLRLRNRVEAAIYGLMVQGCPAPDRSICAFELWREALQSS